jgi:hypothetical protein
MSESAGAGESEKPGINQLQLNTDRARDELADTLAEIERRLQPKEILASTQRAVRKNWPRLAAGAGVVAGVVTLILVARHRRS